MIGDSRGNYAGIGTKAHLRHVTFEMVRRDESSSLSGVIHSQPWRPSTTHRCAKASCARPARMFTLLRLSCRPQKPLRIHSSIHPILISLGPETHVAL